MRPTAMEITYQLRIHGMVPHVCRTNQQSSTGVHSPFPNMFAAHAYWSGVATLACKRSQQAVVSGRSRRGSAADGRACTASARSAEWGAMRTGGPAAARAVLPAVFVGGGGGPDCSTSNALVTVSAATATGARAAGSAGAAAAARAATAAPPATASRPGSRG